MLQSYDPYYRVIPNIISEQTKIKFYNPAEYKKITFVSQTTQTK